MKILENYDGGTHLRICKKKKKAWNCILYMSALDGM